MVIPTSTGPFENGRRRRRTACNLFANGGVLGSTGTAPGDGEGRFLGLSAVVGGRITRERDGGVTATSVGPGAGVLGRGGAGGITGRSKTRTESESFNKLS